MIKNGIEEKFMEISWNLESAHHAGFFLFIPSIDCNLVEREVLEPLATVETLNLIITDLF